MHEQRRSPDLERIAATQLSALLDGVAVGSPLAVDSSSDMCDTLEVLIPAILRRRHPEWERESLDGFFLSRAVKTDRVSADFAGTCILIADQTVTPFALSLSLSDAGGFAFHRIRLGEPGTGGLGISGPACHSRAALELLSALNERLDRVAWVYDVS
jgi:hypothetical protein